MCESCLTWFHLDCMSLKQHPKCKVWFCLACCWSHHCFMVYVFSFTLSWYMCIQYSHSCTTTWVGLNFKVRSYTYIKSQCLKCIIPVAGSYSLLLNLGRYSLLRILNRWVATLAPSRPNEIVCSWDDYTTYKGRSSRIPRVVHAGCTGLPDP